MDFQTLLIAVEKWSPEARTRLIEAVWDGLSQHGEEFELTDELRELLDRRLADLESNPGEVLSWEDIQTFVRRAR